MISRIFRPVDEKNTYIYIIKNRASTQVWVEKENGGEDVDPDAQI